MRVKNIRQLQLRADWHAEKGHVLQGTYGNVDLDGKVEFFGCAVGCLSTPHTKTRLLQFLREHVTKDGGSLDHESRGQREDLTREFGLTPMLITAVEGLFEGQPTHGAAIEFVPKFAHALHEGAEITDEDIEQWIDRQAFDPNDYDDWNEIHQALEWLDPSEIQEITADFLHYVGSFKAAGKEVLA